ncbi:MAG: GNAT family N-acetyltransferase [Acidobacteria bacterium]|nr:GNAT family N-acetyltransferase [Acidobacteriota bacterium]
MEYAIRPARNDEIVLISEIEHLAATLFLQTEHANEVEGLGLPLPFLQQAQQLGQLLVATNEEDIPVGFAAITILDGQPHLHELDVRPEYGRRGIGTKLVSAVSDWSKNHGYDSVTLSTFRDVPWNAPFYERLGFVRMDEEDLPSEMLLLRKTEAEDGLDLSRRVVMKMLI